ncbi:hypothetical protein SNE23_28085 (plasmid) [Bacillus sp. RA(2023)]|uniref:hypothetical protein n=1 Tax=Bacillus TaxID=1386 RepID=UPI000BF8B175|nr:MULTISPECIES: hypothetical protein [Bacillus]PFB76746.1 hypothetical protein CN286_19540 [Bacillus anthracis]WPU77982.1 hypothetical protein SNE23_28085 [Bacillus sp. RA(2023)]
MIKKSILTGVIGLLCISCLFWFMYPSPYLEELNQQEQKLYNQFHENNNIYVLKDQSPKTIVRLFLYSIQQEHYETTYHFYTTLHDEEDKKMFLKSATSQKEILFAFKFANNPIETRKYYARIKLPSFFNNKYFEMSEKDGIWLINEPSISIR